MKQLLSPEENPGYAPVAESKSIDVPVHEIVMWLFILAALAFLGYALFGGSVEGAVQEAALCAASAACGVIARIAQAGGQHDKVMRELKRLR